MKCFHAFSFPTLALITTLGFGASTAHADDPRSFRAVSEVKHQRDSHPVPTASSEQTVGLKDSGGGCAPAKGGPTSVSANGTCGQDLNIAEFRIAVEAKYPRGRKIGEHWVFVKDGVEYQTSIHGPYLRKVDPKTITESKVDLALQDLPEVVESINSAVASTEANVVERPAPVAAPTTASAATHSVESPLREPSYQDAYGPTSNPMWDVMNMTNEDIAAEKTNKANEAIKNQNEKTYAAHEFTRTVNPSYVNPYSAPGVLRQEPSPLMQHYVKPVSFPTSGNGSMLKKQLNDWRGAF